MNATNRKQMGSVSLDQLLALNDEIAALVRAGIPLEKGLTELGAMRLVNWVFWPPVWPTG